MDKPTIFFSHSSKDSNFVLPIKERLTTITGGTIDIFLSSDGQSIPLGRNWVHKIEEGLKKSTIMFVFITPNSIASNWIYFEAGFAYSKDIRVIPVGLGVDIAILKAPLNLLQGFNVISGDSLNNFVSVINDTYSFNFKEAFSNEDFESINSAVHGTNPCIEYSNIFKSITYTLLGVYWDGKDGNIFHDIKAFFENILEYLNEQGVQYSKSERGTVDVKGNTEISSYTILVQGVKISYSIGAKNFTHESKDHEKPRIRFEVSPYNFEQSLTMFVSLAKLCADIEWTVLNFSLLPHYVYVTADSDISAVLFSRSEVFTMSRENVGSFSLKDKDVNFWIRDNYASQAKNREHLLGVSFKSNEMTYRDVSTVLDSLVENNIIKRVS